MDDGKTQISITIDPRFIERLIYWIIIIALAVLLVLAYLRDDCTPKAQDTTEKPAQEQVAAPPVAPPKEETPAVKQDTCTDAKLSGDETDIDCGGSCAVKCASGKVCKANADCVSGICTNGACTNTAPSSLSGKLELDVTDVDYEEASSGAVKVKGLTYTIKNGLSEDVKGQLKVFLKSKSNTACLNQGTSTDCDVVFATINLPRVATGKTYSESHEIQKDEFTSGSYVQKDDRYYNYDDPSRKQFNVVAYLYDSDGNMIGGKSISDAVLVDP